MSEKQENSLRKYNIGTVKHPYPMTFRVQDASGRFHMDLGVLQNDQAPLEIYSECSFSDIVGRMYRDMPTPSMLEVFKQGHIQRQPEHNRKVEFFMGDAGAGKSFLASSHAKLRDSRGAMLVDCGGRDLNDLIYETVLDYDSGKTIYDAIDKKLAEGTLNPASVNKLRNALGNAFKEENGSIAIDWEEVGIARVSETELESMAKAHQKAQGLSDEELQTLDAWSSSDDKSKDAPSRDLQSKYAEYTKHIDADFKTLYAKAERDRDNAIPVIREIADMEGLNQDGSASIGLQTREGPLIRADRENRPIILDEYNKAKPGTDDALQILWQVYNGEMDKHTVSKGGLSYTFDSNRFHEHDNKRFVTLTGNKTRDGYSTRSLSASAYQRLKPHYIEPPTVEDLQHRICQKLTGMPVSTIYKAQEEYWSENKEQFTDFLIDMRKRGLSDEQQANIPSWQFEMLKNWDKVMKASEQLATFYDQWAQVIDPDSKLHSEASGELGQILGQVDKQYAAEVGVGLRRMMSHMDEATMIVPEAIPSKASQGVDPMTDWDQPDELEEKDHEPVERRYGTRLSKVILKDINDTAQGNDKDLLLDWLLKKAGEAGLFETVLEEGLSTRDRLVSDLLDVDPEKEKEVPENIEEIHSVLCDYLRERFPDIAPDAENADIISPSALEHAMTELGGLEEVKRLTTRTGGVVHLPSVELGEDNPMTRVVSVESRMPESVDPNWSSPEEIEHYNKVTSEEEELREVPKLPSAELADAERFLISLAIPGASRNNVDALFSPIAVNTATDNSDGRRGPIIDMQSNTASNGLAATMLLARTGPEGQEKDEFLHIVRDSFANHGEGRTLVTGTVEISPRLEKALEKTGVTYVNRNHPDAKDKINAALDDILADKSDLTRQNCNDQILCNVLGSRLSLQPTGVEQSGKVKVRLYDLPHQDIYTNKPNTVVSDDLRGKHRENLTALLADEREYIAATDKKYPVYLTDSPDLDHLKNTVRSLTNDGQQKAAGMGK